MNDTSSRLVSVLIATATAVLLATHGGCGGSGDATAGSSECGKTATSCPMGCDPSLGCLQCISDGDCGGGKPMCVLGKCEECEGNADCGAGQACYPRSFECKPVCASNGDCGGDEPICSDVTGQCVGCLANSDCGGGNPVCNSARAQCGECAFNADCGAAKPVCDISDGKCHQCLVDSQCGAGEVCDGKECRSVCYSNADCRDDKKAVCLVGDGICVECQQTADCTFDDQKPICDGDFKCKECKSNAECQATGFPLCQDDGRCVECLGNADCPSTAPACNNGTCQ